MGEHDITLCTSSQFFLTPVFCMVTVSVQETNFKVSSNVVHIPGM